MSVKPVPLTSKRRARHLAWNAACIEVLLLLRQKFPLAFARLSAGTRRPLKIGIDQVAGTVATAQAEFEKKHDRSPGSQAGAAARAARHISVTSATRTKEIIDSQPEGSGGGDAAVFETQGGRGVVDIVFAWIEAEALDDHLA
jgi:hypothetical protein